MIYQRALKFFRRRQNAQKLGINYWGAKKLTLPDQIIILNKAHQVYLPKDDLGMKFVLVEILLDDCYGLQDFKKQINKPQLKILDLGANVGLFSFFARNFFPDATIHAYEPNQDLEKYLKVQANSTNFTYFLEAVGGEAGKVLLETKERSALNSVKIDDNGDIPMVSLETAIDRLGGKVDLAKIDCEGAEWLMLENPAPWQFIDNLALEYHLKKTTLTLEDLRKIIQDLGFKITHEIALKSEGLIRASR